jgi:hypothetical protein
LARSLDFCRRNNVLYDERVAFPGEHAPVVAGAAA